MNILLVSDTYEPQINGLVTALKVQRGALRKSGHRIYLLVPRLCLYYDPRIIPYPCFPLLRLNRFKIPLPFSLRNFLLLRKLKIDLIHTHTPFSMGLYGLFLGKILKIPLVHTYHTYFEEYLHYVGLRNAFGRWLVKKFSAWYCNRMDGIVAPSEFIRGLLKKYGVKKRIEVIPTGVDFGRFSREPEMDWRSELGIPRSSRVLLYTGRLEKEKNLYFLLDAFGELAGKYGAARLVITGDGSERRRLERTARSKGLAGRVFFTGFVRPECMRDIYRCADLFVFASLTETEGLVLLEAMINKVPVVAFYERGTKTLLPARKMPGISPVRSASEFKKEIGLYLEGAYSPAGVRKNLEKYIRRFDEKIFIRKMVRLYGLCLDRA